MKKETDVRDSRGLRFILQSAFFILHSNTLIVLCALTIFAGAIRFYHLSQPTVWYDESMVFRRTCGSYSQLLDCLRTDGFVPLHYSLVWVIAQWFKLTPTVLRFVPALCGTLMVPAVYFLARQLLNRTTSLLAAAFTACSAFMLFYSRDAKMYMDAWLFVTVNAGCLLWWFRSNRMTAWLCWIASGSAACGIHFSSALPLAISSLLLFTQRRLRWQQAMLWIAGIVVILSGPVGYYEKFNRWEDRVNQDGWRDSGLEWINDYNYGRTGSQLFRFLGTSMMMGWEWPKDADIATIPVARFNWPARGAELLLVTFIASCLPWPLRWREEGCTAGLAHRWAKLIVPEPQWRVALWLSLWIVLPLYGFYGRSMPNFFSPLEIWHWLAAQHPILLLPIHHQWIWILIGLLFAGWIGLAIRFESFRSPMRRAFALVIVLLVVIGLCQVMAIVMASLSQAATDAGKPWQSLWVPRYIGFIWPMLAVAVAALLMRLPTRWVRVPIIAIVLLMNLGVGSYRIFGHTEPPVDVMAADAFAGENPDHRTICWTHFKHSNDYPGGANLYGEVGEYYSQLLENKPMNPLLFRDGVRDRQQQNLGVRSSPWDRPIPAEANRIIIWRQYDSAGVGFSVDRTSPGSDWKLQSDDWFAARDCWIWRDLDRYRRTVYVR